MDARGKFGEHGRCVRILRDAAEGNSSFLSALELVNNICEQWLVITASLEDRAAVVFVSNKFMSSCVICPFIVR